MKNFVIFILVILPFSIMAIGLFMVFTKGIYNLLTEKQNPRSFD